MNRLLFAIFGLFSLLGMGIFPALVDAQATDEIDVLYEQQLEELAALEEELAQLEAMADSFVAPETNSFEVRGVIIRIESDEIIDGQRQMVFVVEAGEDRGNDQFIMDWYTVDTSNSLLEGLRYDLEVGDEVYLQVITEGDELAAVYLVDVVRTGAILWMVVLFAAVILAVGHWRGAASLLGLAVTLVILLAFVLPMILQGAHPVLITVIGAVVILAVNMHLSHGFNRPTLFAFASTAIGLVLAWIFAELFVGWGNLSGLASEESILLFFQAPSIDWPAGILLAGIILGATGVLDDIAITQSETVQELRDANPNLDRKELFMRAMRVGRHHIASTINTLVLAYVGVALPLFLLFLHTQGVDLWRFLNEEPVAEEVIRTLAGTLALILTVPISTWLATLAQKK